MTEHADELEQAAEEAETEGSIPERRRTATAAGQGATVEDGRVADDTPEQSPGPEHGKRA